MKEKLQSTASDVQNREKIPVDSFVIMAKTLFFFFSDLFWGESLTAVNSPIQCIIYRPVAFAVFFQAQGPFITATISSYRAKPCRRCSWVYYLNGKANK